MAIPAGNYPGSGVGVNGFAFAQAQPRPEPLTLDVQGAQDGPNAAELRAAWQAYDGRFGSADGPLAAQAGVPNLNVRSNRIKAIVNTGVDFLFGAGLSIRCEADDAEAILDAVWGDDDQRMTTMTKLALNGGVYGHIFVKIVPPKRGVASAENPPRLALLNPETVTMETDPEDADLVVRYTIEYATTGANGVALRKRQTITRVDPRGDDLATGEDPTGGDADTTWSVQNWTATGLTAGRFIADGPAVVWPYTLPPIVDWQNYPNPNAHWGQRDVTQSLVDLNNQLRLVESNINKIGFLQGHPFLFATGADTGGLKPTPGQIIDLGAPDADLKAVNAAGDLAQLMAFANTLRSDMDEESGVPGVATGRMETLPRGQVSGITMRLLYAPLLARNEHKRRLYGQGIRQICQTALLVCGLAWPDVQTLDLELGWQDPLPSDDLAMAQTVVALQGIGFSQHTLIDMAGGDPDVEAEYRAEEQQAQMSAVMHGAAMPPAPATPPEPKSAETAETAGEPEPEPTATPAAPAKPAAKPAIDPNHPAAIVARAKVRAAFGKPPMPPTKAAKPVKSPARRRK